MKRILMLLSVAAMLAAAMALSGVAQAAPTIATKADAKCLAEAAKTVKEPGFNPADYTFHGGTEGNDGDFQATADPDVFCGFGGGDDIVVLEAGDIFLGGEGIEIVDTNNGTAYGGEGDDIVAFNNGTFNGGEGNDLVGTNSGTFYGGPDDDVVLDNVGTYYGQEGNDRVEDNAGHFDGGDGFDSVVGVLSNTGTIINVEVFPTNP